MPNWVKNIIRMKGISREPFIFDEDGCVNFDFNKFIPMPKSLDMESGSRTDENILYYLTERCTIPVEKLSPDKRALLNKLVTNMFAGDKWPEQVFLRVMSQTLDETKEQRQKRYDAGKTYMSNYQLYGATTWYDWCRNNWGTKWNAGDTVIIDSDTIGFDTAWSSPEPVILKLAEMYPEAEIEHWWADENIGCNDGYAKYSGGKAVKINHYDDNSNEAYDTYVHCWGESACLYKDEDGIWYHYECDKCHGCD